MKRLSMILVGVLATSMWFAGCSGGDKGSPKTTTKSGTGGAGLGGAMGQGGAPLGNSICGLKPDQLSLKTESEETAGHRHIVDIPINNLQNRLPGAFTLQANPAAMHTHVIHLTGADMVTLVTTGSLTVTSTRTLKHSHEVHLVCPL